MASSDPPIVQEGTKTKVMIAAIAASATVIAGLISAIVSWTVSQHTLEREEWRDRAENTVQRAALFKELIDEVSAGRNTSYAILALWKLYEDDRRLVVITALQSDDPKAIEVLRLLGLQQELVGFQNTFINVIDNAGPERRSELLLLLSDIYPNQRVDLSIESIINERSTDFARSISFRDLAALLRQRPEFRERVAERMAKDDRISSSVSYRFTVALALYAAGETDPFDFLIEESASDMALLAQVAPLLVKGSQVVNYNSDDQIRQMRLSVELMRHSAEIQNGNTSFYNGLRVFRSVLPRADMASEERSNILDFFESYFRDNPSSRITRERILDVVADLDKERAIQLYYSAISCEESAASELFFHASNAIDIIFDGDGPTDFETGRQEGLERLQQMGLTCESWRA